MRAIAQARRLLSRDPNAALLLLDRVGRLHPAGYFVEEREALRILALMSLGQTDRARRRAEAFLRVYPHSPFADRVRALKDR